MNLEREEIEREREGGRVEETMITAAGDTHENEAVGNRDSNGNWDAAMIPAFQGFVCFALLFL